MAYGSFVMCAVQLGHETVSQPIRHPWRTLPQMFSQKDAHERAREWIKNNHGPARPNCVVTVTKLKTSTARADMSDILRSEHRLRGAGYDKGDPS